MFTSHAYEQGVVITPFRIWYISSPKVQRHGSLLTQVFHLRRRAQNAITRQIGEEGRTGGKVSDPGKKKESSMIWQREELRLRCDNDSTHHRRELQRCAYTLSYPHRHLSYYTQNLQLLLLVAE